MNVGLMISGNGQKALELAIHKVSELIDEDCAKFISVGGNEREWKGMLVTTPECGSTMRLRDLADLPLVDRICPCGNPEHWLIKYDDSDHR